jgi:hypothetical protein
VFEERIGTSLAHQKLALWLAFLIIIVVSAWRSSARSG